MYKRQPLNGLQHNPVKYLFPDIVDFAGACVALVVREDEMVLAVILVGVASAEVQLGSAVGTVKKPGKDTGFSCLGRPALVFPQLLHLFPLAFLNDGRLRCV